MTVTPALQWSRPVMMTHVYHALAIEEELKRAGALRFDLSDATVLKIAELVSRNDSYRLRDHNEFKKFKDELDAIIRADAAADEEREREALEWIEAGVDEALS